MYQFFLSKFSDYNLLLDLKYNFHPEIPYYVIQHGLQNSLPEENIWIQYRVQWPVILHQVNIGDPCLSPSRSLESYQGRMETVLWVTGYRLNGAWHKVNYHSYICYTTGDAPVELMLPNEPKISGSSRIDWWVNYIFILYIPYVKN